MKKGIFTLGISLLFICLIALGLIFYPVFLAEVNYFFKGKSQQVNIVAKNDEFDIIIPKIDIKAKVLPNIDPFDKQEYLEALKKGVAQAKGSANPGQKGNIFIFAHSTDIPANFNQYNAVFYLLYKLQPGDEVFLTYQGNQYRYVVESISIAGKKEVDYLRSENSDPTLTLMTCWPPGTTLKRLLVKGRLTENVT